MDELKQQLSRLLDNDLPATEREVLIEKLLTDPQAKAVWQRYNLVRDAMQGKLDNKTNVLEGVRAEIEKLRVSTRS